MKRLSIIAILLAAPLAAMAQFVVFSDNFTHGSTLNKTSVPGGTPFASFTSYDIASTKGANTGPALAGGKLIITLNSGTTSGMVEGQAVFTQSPISLQTIGDYVNLTYTFLSTNLMAGGTNSYIWTGLYNSGGTTPVPGGLNSSGLTTAANSAFATGNCQLWQGYVSSITSNGLSRAYTRPAQNGGYTSSANQDLVGAGANSGNYTNPAAVVFDAVETNFPALANGQVYTVSYMIVLSAPGQITVTNSLYSGAGTGGTLVFSQTNTATDTNVLTTSFDGLAIGVRNNGASLNPSMAITNLVISENISGLPGQPFDVTGGGIGCPGQTFSVGLDGSVANNNYYLYTNGVWTGILQSGTGSALNFGPQTVLSVPLTNTVIASNTVNSFTGSMLGSALVAPNSPPVITNQPIPVIVANGSIGVFTVGASGGDLSYQWFKNNSPLSNGGNITGATNATLVISPVGAGDAANYFCTLTSGCLVSSNSVTNSLTIAAPAGITWQGNNPNSNWDLSTTANFLNGSTPVVFHNGDDVTFGSSPATETVNITGNFIAPGTMTDNSSLAYTFNGPGVIQGPGSLLVNGGGLLTINNSNAYTGGTTISSGTVSLNNGSFSSAGTGTITLAGGTLDIPLKAGSAAGLSNNINTAASSTLQIDQNGTFACVLDGELSGDPGTSLNVFSSFSTSTTTARIRMYGAFTNNSDITLTYAGQAEIEFAPYLSSGNQVFNGVISGTAGHIVPRGAGSVILNGANTFTDATDNTQPWNVSLLMSSGNVGIGADSVQTAPPAIVSSPLGIGLVAINVGTEGGTCSFFASGGAHTNANQLIYTSATNTVTVIFGGANDLTFTGEFDLANPSGSPIGSPIDTNGTVRTLNVTNTGATTFAGVISDNANTSGFTKTGGGSLYLNGTNTYTGPTTNNGGVLAGSGYIGGSVVIGTNGSIGGGSSASIGTLTLSNSLTINGNVAIRVDKSQPTQSNDVVSVNGALANIGTGTVTVNNLGPALVVGDRFQIFNKGVSGGAALAVTGGGAGVTWNNSLLSDGSISVQSIGPSGPTTNATITHVSLSGTNLLIHGTNNNVPNTSFHFQVLTSTNVATPLSNWTPGATLPFNPDGTFDYTNPIVPGTPRQFIDVKAVP